MNPATTELESPLELDPLAHKTAFVAVPRHGDRPASIGPYAINAVLGEGAMGKVYLATHTKLKRKVALKVLPQFYAQSSARIARFVREMEAVGRLDHPNIVRATDAGEVAGTHFIAMEFVEGVDVQELANQEDRLDPAAACEIVRQTAIGLQHIRDHRLVHRDIKPSNLIVSRSGQVKILDLGIARLRSDDEVGTLTADGGLMGTPDFVAPEQILDVGCVDVRADIYSLGCTLYRLLAGRAPFEGPDYGTHAAKVIGHTQKEPDLLSTLAPELPSDLIDFIRGMMAKDPAERIQTPGEVASEMSRWSSGEQLPSLVAKRLRQPTAVVGVPEIDTDGDDRRGSSASPDPSSRHRIRGALELGLLAILGSLGVGALALSSRSDSGNPSADANERSRTATELVENIDRNTHHIAETLDQLRDTFVAASKGGQIIANPTSTGEIYYNAKAYARQGKHLLARESYLRLIRAGTPFVDVHKSFQRLLVLQEGISRARETYDENSSFAARNPSFELAIALLQDPKEKRASLQSIVDRYPRFAPAFYELSRCSSHVALGTQTFAEQSAERELLQQFVKLHEEGELLRHYLDQTEAAAIIDTVEQRLIALCDVDAEVLRNPVRASFVKHKRGWTVNLQISEPCEEIWYATDESKFRSTGSSETVNLRTGEPSPLKWISLPATNTPSVIHVKYVDVRGQQRGPFAIPFEAEKAELDGAKRMLSATRGSWVKFGEGSDRGNLYFTHLTTYRNVISEVGYGLNVEHPLQTHQLPDLEKGETKGFFVSLPDDVRFVVVQLTFSDNTQSDVVRIDRN